MSQQFQALREGGASPSDASVYAFANQASADSQGGIGTTMDDIQTTLDEIGEAIGNLRPEWVAMEADSYYEIIEQWKEGANGVAGVLANVRDALAQTHAGNAELRSGITQILSEMT